MKDLFVLNLLMSSKIEILLLGMNYPPNQVFQTKTSLKGGRNFAS